MLYVISTKVQRWKWGIVNQDEIHKSPNNQTNKTHRETLITILNYSENSVLNTVRRECFKTWMSFCNERNRIWTIRYNWLPIHSKYIEWITIRRHTHAHIHAHKHTVTGVIPWYWKYITLQYWFEFSLRPNLSQPNHVFSWYISISHNLRSLYSIWYISMLYQHDSSFTEYNFFQICIVFCYTRSYCQGNQFG